MYKIPNITELDEQDFISEFAIVPEDEDTLDLSQQVYSKSSYELYQGFRSLPLTVTTIQLEFNALGMMNNPQLKQTFSGLHSTVKNVCLRGNGFRSLMQFQEIFKAMPHVTKVELEEGDYNLNKMGSAEEIGKLFATFKNKTFQLYGDSPLVKEIIAHYETLKASEVRDPGIFFQPKADVRSPCNSPEATQSMTTGSQQKL